jgi:hypothetical protein
MHQQGNQSRRFITTLGNSGGSIRWDSLLRTRVHWLLGSSVRRKHNTTVWDRREPLERMTQPVAETARETGPWRLDRPLGPISRPLSRAFTVGLSLCWGEVASYRLYATVYRLAPQLGLIGPTTRGPRAVIAKTRAWRADR